MTSPRDVPAFHARYDRRHTDHVALFAQMRELLPADSPVFYPGSFVDLSPSVWFDHVDYLDLDKRANQFFAQREDVDALIRALRIQHEGPTSSPTFAFHHQDFSSPVDLPDSSMGLLVSLYAGPISRHCGRYLRVGGLALVHPSHGDAAMASLDDRYQLAAVIDHADGTYSLSDSDLEQHLIPKRDIEVTEQLIEETGRGVDYTQSPFAYLFERIR